MKLFTLALLSLTFGLAKVASAQNLSEAYNTLKYKESRSQAAVNVCADLAYGPGGKTYLAAVCLHERGEMIGMEQAGKKTIFTQETYTKFVEKSREVEDAYHKCVEDFYTTCSVAAEEHLKAKK